VSTSRADHPPNLVWDWSVAALGALYALPAAALAARFRLGTIAMTLCLPMFGVGLSYSDVGKAAGLAGLMILGSVFACVVSMLWPERPPPALRSPPPPGAKPTLGYGFRLGAAGATAAVYSVAIIAVIASAGATHRSRWYVTAGFTTFLVFLMLLYSDPHTAARRFNERVLETLLGVGIAYFYGLALPALARQRRD
jgi:hypothetical protein